MCGAWIVRRREQVEKSQVLGQVNVHLAPSGDQSKQATQIQKAQNGPFISLKIVDYVYCKK